MKTLLLLILSIISASNAISQEIIIKKKNPFNWKEGSWKAASFVIPAFAGSTHEVLLNKYGSFKKVFPGADDQYWDPEISHVNKYYRGWPHTTFPLLTDGRHLTAGIRSGGLVICTGLFILGEKKPWWHHVINLGLSSLTYGLTTNIVYDRLYK